MVKEETAFHPAPWESREKTVPIYCSSKDDLVDGMVRSFMSTGSAFEGAMNDLEVRVNDLMVTTSEWAIEQMYKKQTFLYHRAGGSFFALMPDISQAERRFVVKLVKPGINREKLENIWYGYRICKRSLGKFGTPTSLCRSIIIRIRDTEWVPRLVSFAGIIQQRAIVAEDIFNEIGGTLNERRLEIMDKIPSRGILKRLASAREDKVLDAGSRIQSRMANDYRQWKVEVAKLGLYDKDSIVPLRNRRFSPDRNYGYLFLSEEVPEKWGLVDYRKVREEQRKIVAFDFDGFNILDSFRGKSLRINRIPDVFEKEIKEALEELLEKVLVKK